MLAHRLRRWPTSNMLIMLNQQIHVELILETLITTYLNTNIILLCHVPTTMPYYNYSAISMFLLIPSSDIVLSKLLLCHIIMPYADTKTT